MDDAALDERFREDGMHGIGERGQSIHAGDENVFHPSVLQVGHYREPEVGAEIARQWLKQNSPSERQASRW